MALFSNGDLVTFDNADSTENGEPILNIILDNAKITCGYGIRNEMVRFFMLTLLVLFKVNHIPNAIT